MSDPYSTQSAPQGDPGNGPPQGQGQGNSIYDRWNTWIDKPGNRAAMMQFGIAMLQPMQPGESLLGHAANAIGYGGEAENRVEQQQQQGELRQSQEDLRGAQAEAQIARANTAGMGAELQRERLENTQRGQSLNALVRLQPAYYKEKSDWELTHDPTKEPFMSFQDWMENRGINPQTGGGPPSQGDATNPQQQEQKPLTKDILANPRYRQQFEMMKRNPDKKAVKAQLDRIAPRVSDPQTLYKEFGVQ